MGLVARRRVAWAAWLALMLAPVLARADAPRRYAPGVLVVKYRESAGPTLWKHSQGLAALDASPGLAGLGALHKRLGVTSVRRAIRALDDAGVSDRKSYLTYLAASHKPRLTGVRGDLSSAPDLQNVYRLTLADASQDMEAAAQQYAGDPNVEYAHPDYFVKLAAVPNDPSYNQQWAHQIMGSEAGWDVTTGVPGVVVAVIDTGVDWSHPDLSANIWSNPGETAGNGVDDDGNGYVDDIRGWDFVDLDPSNAASFAVGEDLGPADNDPMDFYGHGTLMAGTIAAVGNNGTGIAGMCWTCKIMPLRVGAAERDTGNAYILSSWVANAIQYAAVNGADVINLSLTDPGWPNEEKDAIDLAYSMDVVIVAAAGNTGEGVPVYPAAYPKVIGVAATDQTDQRAVWSTPQPPLYEGASSNYGTWVKVAAPGSAIFSTAFKDTYAAFDGTSFSAAYVSGLAALIRSKRPALKNSEVMQIIQSAVATVHSDKYIGAGRIDVNQALHMTAVSTAVITSPVMEQTLAANVAVQGSASGAAFASYSLTYGQGLYPASMTTIVNSNTPVVNGTLGNWNVAGLTDNQVYTVHLRVTDTAANHTDTEVVVSVQKNVVLGWPKTLSGSAEGDGVAVGDLDNDGKLEIVAFSDRPIGGGLGREDLYAFTADGTPVLGWPVTDRYDFNGDRGSPTLADLTGSGRRAVIASGYTFLGGNYTTQFDAFDVNGAELPGWPQVFTSTDGFLSSTPAVGDLDGDGSPEIVFTSKKDGAGTTAMIFAFHANGTKVAGWPRAFEIFPPFSFTEQDGASHPVLADLDGDGKPEIVVALGFQNNSMVYAFHGDGSIMAGWPVTMPDEFVLHPVAADLDGNGQMAIVGTTEGGGIYVFNANGTTRAGWPVFPATASGFSAPVVGDLDGDGKLEIIAHSDDDKVYAYHSDGTPVAGWPVPVQALGGNSIWPTPILADLDGDGHPEVIQASADETLIYAWHGNGTLGAAIPGWPITLTQPAFLAPAIADFSGSGSLQMAYAYADQVNVRDLNTPATRAAQVWPMAWYDQNHTGKFSADVTPPALAITPPGVSPLSGVVTIHGTAADNVAVARVELAVDAGAYGLASGTANWSFSLNTLSLPNGSRTLKARATDTAGNTAVTTLSVTVANAGADLTSPTVNLLTPTDGTTVAGSITATISGSDNVAATKVELDCDGLAVASKALSPPVPSFNVSLTWRPPTSGSHTLQAKAYDAAGNVGASATVSVKTTGASKVSLVRSSGGSQMGSTGDNDAVKPRAMMLTVRQNQKQTLQFDDSVQQVTIIDWHGHVFKRASKGAGAIQVVLADEGNNGLPMSSGVWVIQMKDASGATTAEPLVVVK